MRLLSAIRYDPIRHKSLMSMKFAVNDSKWRKKREAHGCTLSGSMGISYCSSLISTKTQTHASSKHAGMTSLPIINIQAWFFEKNQNVCYYVQIRLFFGATIFHTYYSYCTCACVKFEIIDRFLKSLLPIIYRNY